MLGTTRIAEIPVGHRAALADLDHDLESRDRCAAREVELTAEGMLHAGGDVGNVHPR